MCFTALMALALTAVDAAPTPAPAAPADEEVVTIDRRVFSLPVVVEESQAKEIESIDLYVSTDRGKTWNKISTSKPDTSRSFGVMVPADGLYWFAVLIVQKDGKTFPEKVADLRPAQKVMVATQGGPQPREARKPTPEQRIADLEKQVAELKAALKQLEKRLAEAEKAR